MSLTPAPQEMSDAALEKLFPEQGSLVKRLPTDTQYELLQTVNEALKDSADAATPYNAGKLTIYDFRWAVVQYYKTTQLCSESIATGRVHAGDVALIPINDCQTYQVELNNLAKPA